MVFHDEGKLKTKESCSNVGVGVGGSKKGCQPVFTKHLPHAKQKTHSLQEVPETQMGPAVCLQRICLACQENLQ